MILDLSLLALRNIRKRGLRSWLTMLGIFIGIAAVVSLISLGQGLQGAITGQFADLAPDRLVVTSSEAGFGPPGSTAVRKLNEHDLEIIERVQGVKYVIPRLIRVSEVEFNKISKYKYLASMPDNQEQVDLIYESFNMEIEKGRKLNANDEGKIVLGDDFVANDEFDKDIKVGSKIKIQGRDFEVIGILKKASTFQINSVVMMIEKDMEEILEIKDEFDLIAVLVKDSKETEVVSERIKEAMRNDRAQKEGEEDFSVQTPVEALSSINTILNIVNLVVASIAGISLLVGGIGIANTMFTSVLERRKEIGVMKAVGAENEDILVIFLVEAALLGIVGGVIGILIGLSLAFGASILAKIALGGAIDLEVVISLPLVFLSLSFSLIIGIISGVVPAIQASKLHPVEALRQ
jgi:putative ABC transport system permease protein